jgi:hypothetical protein
MIYLKYEHVKLWKILILLCIIAAEDGAVIRQLVSYSRVPSYPNLNILHASSVPPDKCWDTLPSNKPISSQLNIDNHPTISIT